MGLELEIRAEKCGEEVMRLPTSKNSVATVPVVLYHLYITAPFAFRGTRIRDNMHIHAITIHNRDNRLVYHGKLGTNTAFDSDLVDSLVRCAPVEDSLRYARVTALNKGTVRVISPDYATGVLTIDAVAAYSNK